MSHELLADVVKWFHVLWVVVLLACCVLQAFFIRLALVTGVLGVGTCISQLVWGTCPLTVLEERLRNRAGEGSKYGNEFLVYHLHEWFGLDVAPSTIFALNVALVLFSTLLVVRFYRFVFKRKQLKKSKKEA